jgi:hypothetical protein
MVAPHSLPSIRIQTLATPIAVYRGLRRASSTMPVGCSPSKQQSDPRPYYGRATSPENVHGRFSCSQMDNQARSSVSQRNVSLGFVRPQRALRDIFEGLTRSATIGKGRPAKCRLRRIGISSHSFSPAFETGKQLSVQIDHLLRKIHCPHSRGDSFDHLIHRDARLCKLSLLIAAATIIRAPSPVKFSIPLRVA